MRIVTWNCRGGWPRKKHHIYALNPDLAVIQECSEKAAVASVADGFSVVWAGNYAARGVAVLARAPWVVSRLEEHRYRLLMPVEVAGPTPFLMVAVWTQAVGSATENYVAQAHRAVQERAEWFEGRDVVFSGDFNSNTIWDRKRRPYSHSGMVALFEKRGMQSAYHASRNEVHGSELSPTFYLYSHEGKPYHMDYTFLPKRWRVDRVELGKHAEWSKCSDHMPLITDCTVKNRLRTKLQSRATLVTH